MDIEQHIIEEYLERINKTAQKGLSLYREDLKLLDLWLDADYKNNALELYVLGTKLGNLETKTFRSDSDDILVATLNLLKKERKEIIKILKDGDDGLQSMRIHKIIKQTAEDIRNIEDELEGLETDLFKVYYEDEDDED